MFVYLTYVLIYDVVCSESNEDEPSPARRVGYPGGGKFAGKFSGKGASKFRGKGAAMFRGKAAQMMVQTPSSGDENESDAR